METHLRRPLIVVLAVLSLGAVGAGLAWACSPGATLDPPAPASGEPGDDVTLTGRGFAADQRVAIRWNDENGPLLASVRPDASKTFTVTVKVPADAQNGQAVFVAVPQDPTYTARYAFTVGPAPAQEQPPTTAPAPVAEQPAGTSRPITPAVVTKPERPAQRRETTPAARRPAPAARETPATGRRSRGDGASRDRSQRVAAAARAARERAIAERNAAVKAAPRPAPARADAAPQPSQATAGGDLWSGYAPGSARPSLSDATAPAASPASPLTYGVGLLALGLMTMVAAFGTVAVRRRRIAR